MKTEKIFVEFRSHEYSTLENRIKALYPHFQAIGKELSACGIDHTDVDLQALVSDARTVLMKFLPAEVQTLVKYASSAIQFPDDLNNVIQVVSEAKHKAGHDLQTYAPYFAINHEGEVIPVHSKFNDLKEACTTYAVSEIEMKRLALAQEICDALEKYQALAVDLRVPRFTVYDTHHWGNLKNVVTHDGKRFKPVPHFIKRPG